MLRDPRTVRAAVVTAIFLLFTGVLEVLGLTSGGTGYVIIGLVAAIALAVIAFRVELSIAGVAAACAACFTLTWNGWFVGPLRPGDILVLVALLCLLAGNPNGAFRTPPWWIKQLGIAILLVVVLQIYFPPDPVYLSHRIVLNALGQPTVSTKGSLASANLGVAFKFIVATVAVPLVFTGAALVDRRAIRWLSLSFGLGAALSGWAGTIDHLGGNVGSIVTGLPNIGDRQVGFSNQPNFLAAGCVIAIPFAFWLLASRRRLDWMCGWFALPGLIGGVYASGSRGGAVCAVVVLVLCILLHPRTRAFAPNLLGAMVFVAGVVAVFVPALGAAVLKVTRLAGNSTTAGSDTVRALVGAQGVRDFHESPIRGVGLQVSFEASQVYLQELASGGLILFTAMSIYMLGGIVTAWQLMRRSTLAACLLASVLITLALNIFEADLTDRFYYVPEAILVALLITMRIDDVKDAAGEHEDGDDPDEPDEADGPRPVALAASGSPSPDRVSGRTDLETRRS